MKRARSRLHDHDALQVTRDVPGCPRLPRTIPLPHTARVHAVWMMTQGRNAYAVGRSTHECPPFLYSCSLHVP